jgi:hypothetical protein
MVWIKRILLAVTLTGFLYVFAIGVLVLGPDIRYQFFGRAFDAVAWQNWQESDAEPSLRWEMTKDLTNRYQFRGMPVSKLIELLGEPDTEYADGTLSYYLGMSGRGINTGYLILKVEDNVVVDFEVRQG